MQCPIDKTDLVMSDRHGVEIDYCPKCRGVWLDRGELDKIIERGAARAVANPAEQTNQAANNQPRPDDEQPEEPRKKRKESFLGDLFDF